MDLSFTESEAAFRAECRAWLEENVPEDPLPSGDTAEGFALHLEWERKLFDARWAVVSWPKAYGGREASLFEWLIFEEEYYRANAPNRVTQNGIFLLAPTLFEFGTAEQQARILPDMASGEVTWAQAWSEPNAGSDLASLNSKAVKVEGGWRITGQKIWCTRAAFCDKAFGLFRSKPDGSPYKGMTYMMFSLKAAGVTVRGVDRFDGDEGFADVFLEDVFVPDEDVIGEPNKGWYVAMATTSSERGLTLRSPGRFMASSSRLVDLYRNKRGQADPVATDAVIRAWIAAQQYRWANYFTVTRMVDKGEPMGAASSLNKIFWSEMDISLHEAGLDLLGPAATLEGGVGDCEAEGRWMKDYMFALAGPIYAGTNEIQRMVVARRVLGLPRG